jgi:4-hydroxy-tetrahydrodipicolinate reductase
MMPQILKEINSQKIKEMNIALIGYGRMGHEIEEIAIGRGHKIKLIIDIQDSSDLKKENLKGIDVAMEFSSPESAFKNIINCLICKVPVVSGTTGWLKDYEKAADTCRQAGTSFIHSSNFSIGVNLLFRLNSELARYMSHYEDYSVSIEEIHHIKKLDSPSGTAINLAEGIKNQHSGYKGWCFEKDKTRNMIPVRSVREGTVPGTHIVSWDSGIDTLLLKHEAKSRKGFALGAVVAAEFIQDKKGVFTMGDVLGF